MSHIAIEPTIEVGGRSYKLSRLSRSVAQQYVAWFNKRLPDPIEIAKKQMEGLPPALQEMILKDALQKSKERLTIDSPEVADSMQSLEGFTKLLQLMFKKYQPDVTPEQVDIIAEQYNTEHGEGALETLIADASGRIPDDETDVKKNT